MDFQNQLLTARNMWDHTGVPLSGYGASRTVARLLADRSYDALPRWVKVRLKRDARAARAEVRAEAKRKQEVATLPRAS